MGKPEDIPQDVWDAAWEAYFAHCNGQARLSEAPTENELLVVASSAILRDRRRVNALIDEKAQAFSSSANPLASEMVAALDDLRVCVSRGEIAASIRKGTA